MTATRTFASKQDATAFAKEVGAVVEPLESWNPMRDFGYRWQVRYTPEKKP